MFHRIASVTLLVGLVLAGRARAQPAPLAPEFDVTVIALEPPGGGALVPPAAGASANAAGDVLFAVNEAGKDTVYLRFDSGIRLRVAGVGDPLFGSKVARIIVSPGSLDSYHRALVWAALENGNTGLFRYSPPPAPFAVSPTRGNGAEPIGFHLMGAGFTPGLEVYFGDAKAGFVTVISRSEITGLVPAGQKPGKVTVSVARPGGPRRPLQSPVEFLPAPTSGCQGLCPDHRPQQTSSMPWACWSVAVADVVRLRRSRR